MDGAQICGSLNRTSAPGISSSMHSAMNKEPMSQNSPFCATPGFEIPKHSETFGIFRISSPGSGSEIFINIQKYSFPNQR